MKKIFRTIAISIIILILGVLTLFCTKIYKISTIENIRQKIVKTEENENNVTIVDITNLEDNGNLEHEHIFKTKYDANKHWEECSICGQKSNENTHSYANAWTMGNANNCNENNIHVFTCKCGYNYNNTTGRVGHTIETVNTSNFAWNKRCKKCLKIFDSHDCYRNGTRINCNTLGQCSTCKYTYGTATYHVSTTTKDNVNQQIRCKHCNKVSGTNNKCELKKNSDSQFIFYTAAIVPSGATFQRIDYENKYGSSLSYSKQESHTGTKWYATVTINIDHAEVSQEFRVGYRYSLSGRNYVIWFISDKLNIDTEKPVIQNIKMGNDEQLTEWSRTKPVTITGTENYCNTVKVKITDDQGNTIFNGGGNVSNKNYSIKCTPQVDCDVNGRKFIVTVTDSFGNSETKEFTIAKVDITPPTPTSNGEIGGDWAKSKDFTFIATDEGIGEVQVAFNDIKDLKLAKMEEEQYSRDYKFVGDVYKPKQLSVMYKDGLGNTNIQKITIDKIDNTSPNIINVKLNNNKLIIESNDEHETLGEGSGVIKYTYLPSVEKIDNPKLTEENSIEVEVNEEIKINELYKIKYIYVTAEDLVGNTSKVYEFEVPQLVLTSKVELKTENGKGEIILDWSSYDIKDKHFAIYRKQENQENWEKIVQSEQKLTGSSYIDILGIDKNYPNMPKIKIEKNEENNDINIIAMSEDNGTKYSYYIESYDNTTNQLLNTSNQSSENMTSLF